MRRSSTPAAEALAGAAHGYAGLHSSRVNAEEYGVMPARGKGALPVDTGAKREYGASEGRAGVGPRLPDEQRLCGLGRGRSGSHDGPEHPILHFERLPSPLSMRPHGLSRASSCGKLHFDAST
eukprot:5944984-Prymnesium_polylepis.1